MNNGGSGEEDIRFPLMSSVGVCTMSTSQRDGKHEHLGVVVTKRKDGRGHESHVVHLVLRM